MVRKQECLIPKTGLLIFVMSIVLLMASDSEAAEWILLKGAKINGKPIKMCLDTGSAGIYLTKYAVDRLGLKVADPGTNGLGDTDVYTLNWEGNKFQTDFTILNDNMDCDGTMGWDYVNDNIVRIDATVGTIRASHTPWFGTRWAQFSIMTNFDKLDIEVPHNDGTKGIISIDTGNPYGLLLPPRFWRQWLGTHPHVPVTPRTIVTVYGDFTHEEALADKIQIGSLTLTNVPVTEAPSNRFAAGWGSEYDGNLGMAALSHLDVIADGVHNVVYLRVKKSPASPYSYNRLGATFCEVPGHTDEASAWVLSCTPAYAAGIRDGDILLKIDGSSPLQWTTNWVSPFELPAGTKLHFTLQRNGTNFETVATLRDILKPSNGE
jgi:Aspartyl protease